MTQQPLTAQQQANLLLAEHQAEREARKIRLQPYRRVQAA